MAVRIHQACVTVADFGYFWTVQPYQILVIMACVTVADFGYFDVCNLRRVWLFCLDPLVFSLPQMPTLYGSTILLL